MNAAYGIKFQNAFVFVLNASESESLPIFALLDNEEVGSMTKQGADGTFLSDAVDRICAALGREKYSAVANSFLVSADNAHAVHPNHPEFADATNAPVVNGGVVLKFNANQRYTTDGVTAAMFRKVCQKAGVAVQTYCNRADIPGGSTLGNISLSQVSVPTADIGLPQLAMHSCYETAGVQDVLDLCKAMTEFYSTTLEMAGDSCTLK